jgi:hypothetical protein
LVFLRAGTYSTGLAPSNSGNGTNLPSTFITFQAYTGETPNISIGSGNYLNLTGISYIRVDGITFTLTGNAVGRLEAGSNHNEIKNSTFSSPNGYNINFLIDGTSTNNWSTHNWIHDNLFITSGQAHGDAGLGCTDGGGDSFDIGTSYGTYSTTTDNDNNNTVENNHFEHSPHANIESYATKIVLRNNVFDNEPWSPGCGSYTNSPTYSNSAYNGKFGHRNMEFDDEYNRTTDLTLIEGNRSGFAGVNNANDGADNYTFGSVQAIFRYNYSYGAMNPGLLFKWQCGTAVGGSAAPGSGDGGCFNRVYNNTFYNNGYGYPKGLTCNLSTCPWDGANMAMYSGTLNRGNVAINNIFYQSTGYSQFGSDVLDKGGLSNNWSTLAAGSGNNWCTGSQTDLVSGGAHGCSANGDPRFTNPDLSNPTSTTLPDLSLQSSSTAIDGGTWLTTATNAGSGSTSLTVSDAVYFQDGTWGSDLAKASAGLGGTFQADWIAIGTVSNTVQISSITYGTYNNPAGTVKLASPMTWSSGAHIWLYKKSDGTQVLYGSAPDYGASEYGSGSSGPGTVAPPSGLQATVN